MEELVLAGVRVLLVEDSYDTREGIRVLLKQQGADVTAVASAEEALVRLSAHTAARPPERHRPRRHRRLRASAQRARARS